MNPLRRSRAAALVGAVITDLATVVGLALCGAAGRGLPARIGFGAAVPFSPS